MISSRGLLFWANLYVVKPVLRFCNFPGAASLTPTQRRRLRLNPDNSRKHITPRIWSNYCWYQEEDFGRWLTKNRAASAGRICSRLLCDSYQSTQSIKLEFRTWLELQVLLQSPRKRSRYVDSYDKMCGGTSMSLVSGRNRSRRRVTEYQEAGSSRGWMKQLEMNADRR